MNSRFDSKSRSRTASQVFVWDLPTRLFHWAVLVLMIAQLITGKVLDDAMDLHATLGYAIFVLILFRLIWGFLGSTYARFSHFVHGPGTVVTYARSLSARRSVVVVGHNPLGGWMVVVLLTAILAQTLLGMFGNDDILFEGPFASLVSKETSDFMTGLHGQLFDALLILVGLHIAAVVLHKLVQGENLVSAMFTGYKELPSDFEAEDAQGGGMIRALILLAIIAGVVYWLIG